MSHVEESQVVNAPIAPTWVAVSKIGAVQDWHPNVARAEVLTSHDTGVTSRKAGYIHDRSQLLLEG